MLNAITITIPDTELETQTYVNLLPVTVIKIITLYSTMWTLCEHSVCQ